VQLRRSGISLTVNPRSGFSSRTATTCVRARGRGPRRASQRRRAKMTPPRKNVRSTSMATKAVARKGAGKVARKMKR
jgi:hypothetical protein